MNRLIPFALAPLLLTLAACEDDNYVGQGGEGGTTNGYKVPSSASGGQPGMAGSASGTGGDSATGGDASTGGDSSMGGQSGLSEDVLACRQVMDEAIGRCDSPSRQCNYVGYRPYCETGNTTAVSEIFACLTAGSICQTLFDPSQGERCMIESIARHATDLSDDVRLKVDAICPVNGIALEAHAVMASPEQGVILSSCLDTAADCDAVLDCVLAPDNGTNFPSEC